MGHRLEPRRPTRGEQQLRRDGTAVGRGIGRRVVDVDGPPCWSLGSVVEWQGTIGGQRQRGRDGEAVGGALWASAGDTGGRYGRSVERRTEWRRTAGSQR